MESNSFALIFLGAIPYFLTLHFVERWKADKEEFEVERNNKAFEQQTFDFIIVGGGTAGCVLANRLSEKYTVLLLEAGGPVPVGIGIEAPALFEVVSQVPELNYFYTSKPQRHANNRSFTKTVGKMMGGTNSQNALVHNRGHSKDYDNWANLTKDESWKYLNLLKLFKKSENYIGKYKNDQHGTNGPITIDSDSRPINALWLRAGQEMRYKFGDPNGPQFEGFSISELARRQGRRESTLTGYIYPIRKTRSNLKIFRFANVSNILFNSSDNEHKAIGVNYTRHGVQFSAYAKKEVILSAGVFGTPLLLFKSGIGPFEMLKEAEISPLISNLPVGSNLQDHQGLLLGPFSINNPAMLSSINNNLTEENVKQYSEWKNDGVLSAGALGPQGFFVSSIAKRKGQTGWPDIQMFHVGRNFGENASSTEPILNEFSVAVLVGRPETQYAGTLTLNTEAFKSGIRDPTQLALINYNFMSSPADHSVLLEGIQLALKIFNTKTFLALGASIIPHKCADKYPYNTKAYWDCLIRRTGTTWWSTVGTCRMGFGADDGKAVTDSKLRVLGVKNLRIADASVMPNVVNANTNAAVILIGEKAAAEILEQYSPSG